MIYSFIFGCLCGVFFPLVNKGHIWISFKKSPNPICNRSFSLFWGLRDIYPEVYLVCSGFLFFSEYLPFTSGPNKRFGKIYGLYIKVSCSCLRDKFILKLCLILQPPDVTCSPCSIFLDMKPLIFQSLFSLFSLFLIQYLILKSERQKLYFLVGYL